VRVVAGIGDGLDLLEQILHRLRGQDRAQLGQAVVDDVADGLVLALRGGNGQSVSMRLIESKCVHARRGSAYDGCAPHEVDVMVLDLVLDGKELGNVDGPLQQLLMDGMYIDLLHYLLVVQPLHHLPATDERASG
jgi:hypothetical protein